MLARGGGPGVGGWRTLRAVLDAQQARALGAHHGSCAGGSEPGLLPRALEVPMHTSSRSDHRSRTLSERANKMRHAPTPSEARLFAAVRGRRLGVAFRRQVPVLGKYIVDLLAPEVCLVVEVDGGYHGARRDADARRDRALARAGYRVLRLDTELVMRDAAAVVERVREAIAELRDEQRHVS
jgi:very-short-patch-repair endonuclease